jgi:hypothetical protein
MYWKKIESLILIIQSSILLRLWLLSLLSLTITSDFKCMVLSTRIDLSILFTLSRVKSFETLRDRAGPEISGTRDKTKILVLLL